MWIFLANSNILPNHEQTLGSIYQNEVELWIVKGAVFADKLFFQFVDGIYKNSVLFCLAFDYTSNF